MKLKPIACIAVAAMLGACSTDSSKQTSATSTGGSADRLASSDPVLDAYVRSMRADLSEGKVSSITRIMNLSVEEGKVFWPIYQEYEAALFDLGDQRVDLIRRFAAAQQGDRLDDREAAMLAKGYFEFESDRLELLKRYHDVIAEELSPRRAAQFSQIEHRVGTLVDLMIAAKLPLFNVAEPATLASHGK